MSETGAGGCACPNCGATFVGYGDELCPTCMREAELTQKLMGQLDMAIGGLGVPLAMTISALIDAKLDILIASRALPPPPEPKER